MMLFETSKLDHQVIRVPLIWILQERQAPAAATLFKRTTQEAKTRSWEGNDSANVNPRVA